MEIMDSSGVGDNIFLEPSFRRTFTIWLAWFLRWTLLGLWPFIIYFLVSEGGLFQKVVLGIGALELFFVVPLCALPYALYLVFKKGCGVFMVRLGQSCSTQIPNAQQGFLAPTMKRICRISWAWQWRSALWGFAFWLGPVFFLEYLNSIGYIKVGPSAGTPPGEIPTVVVGMLAGMVGFFGWLVGSVFALKRILKKDFGEFGIYLVQESSRHEIKTQKDRRLFKS